MFGDAWQRYWYINSSNMIMECRSNHNQIIFRGVNDDKQREKLKSITFKRGKLTDVWIEEATELTQQDFEIIDDRLRGELPDGLFYQIRMTFNPVSAQHWIKRVFFDRSDPDVLTHQSTYKDNRFIDAAYYRRMERRKEVDPEGYLVYGLGQWGETKGLILHNWEAKEVPLDLEWYDDVAIGQDFGYNHANAIYPIGIKDGNLYVMPGLYGYEKDTAEWIAEANAKHLPKDLVMWCDSAEPDRIKMWRKAGYRARGVSKESGSIHAQIDWLKGIPDGDRPINRKIYVHPSNVNFIKEIEQWKWKHDDKRNEYLDEPVPFFDDAMAALRYGIEGWRKAQKVHVKTFKGGI
jgi:phage terminase large subunit